MVLSDCFPSPKEAVVIVRILEEAVVFGSRTTNAGSESAWEDVDDS
jgi:hypothetical protein